MMKHITCKIRIYPEDFDYSKQVHIEVQSFNSFAYLVVVKEKGNFETAVYQNFKDGTDKIILSKN